MEAVRPISVRGIGRLNNDDADRHRRGILVIGVDRPTTGYHPELTPAFCSAFASPETVLITARREEFGPQDRGTTAERLGALPVMIVGQFEMGTGFGADGLVVTSAATYARVFGPHGANGSLGLVKLKIRPPPATSPNNSTPSFRPTYRQSLVTNA